MEEASTIKIDYDSLGFCETPNRQLEYVRQEREKSSEEVFCWLKVKKSLLLALSRVGDGKERINVLNSAIPGQAFRISNSSDRIIKLIAIKCCLIKAESCKLNRKGSRQARENFNKDFTALSLKVGDIITAEKWENELNVAQSTIQTLSREIASWKVKYEDLEKEKEELYQEMSAEIEKNSNESAEENQLLKNYVRKLERQETNGTKGTPISKLKSRQAKNRKLKELKTRAQKALYFVEQYGLELSSLGLKSHEGEINYKLKFQAPLATPLSRKSTPLQEIPSNSPPASPPISTSQTTTPAAAANQCRPAPSSHNSTNGNYSCLSWEEKGKVETILFLMDKFGVSDEFVHELSMVVDDIPRSFLIKQCRNDLNSICHITPTPGPALGAQHSFKATLIDRIKSLRAKGILQPGETVKVKISGDGARMTRLTSFQLLSFGILQNTDDILSPKGTHTVAIVNGAEKYDTLAESFADVFRDVNQIIQDGYVKIDDTEVPTEVFLSGDYKFLLMVMGLNAANASYACLWCKIFKKDRGDMSKTEEHYNTPPLARTLDEIKQMATLKSGQNFGCIHQPLLNVDLNHIILDELHLLLRITDVLLDNLIEDAMEWDEEDDWCTKGKVKGVHLKRLVEAINSCGVSFSIWEKRNADGQGSGTYDWTSLMGNEKKRLLCNLPEKLNGIIQSDTADDIKTLWEDFKTLYYGFISSWDPSSAREYNMKIRNWIILFTSLGTKRQGYRIENVTCYMHAAAYHLGQMVVRHNNLKQFSCQGVENNNHCARRVVTRKCQQHDPPAEVLQTQFRLDKLQYRERRHRQYTKRALGYWNATIKEQPHRKKRKATQVAEAAKNTENVSTRSKPKKNKKASNAKKGKRATR